MEKKIACVLGDGFEDSEFRKPYDRLVAAGYEVELIGAKLGEELKGKGGKEKVKVERTIDDALENFDDYLALLVPGGYSPDHIRGDERFVKFAQKFDRAGKLIA